VGSRSGGTRAPSAFVDLVCRLFDELDLRAGTLTFRFFAAIGRACRARGGTVGGILANSAEPSTFLSATLRNPGQLLGRGPRLRVERPACARSSCNLPKHAAQPVTEDALADRAPLSPTNERVLALEVARRRATLQAAASATACSGQSAMPTNL